MAELSGSPEAGTQARLLIVDDERGVRVSMAEYLKLKGYQVSEASSGQEALAMLESADYDLMVLDMLMPGMNGVEVMRRTRQKRPDLLIVVLTAHATLESAITAVKSNVTDYMLKPCSLDDLAITVSRALRERTKQLQRQRLLSMVGEAMDVLRQVEGTSEPAPAPVSASSAPMSANHLLRVGSLTLDRQKRLAMLEDDPTRAIELTEGEASILVVLMEHPNQVLSYNQLAGTTLSCEGLDKWTVESMIRSSVFRLRQKIEAAPDSPRLIRTVRGRGYFFSSA